MRRSGYPKRKRGLVVGMAAMMAAVSMLGGCREANTRQENTQQTENIRQTEEGVKFSCPEIAGEDYPRVDGSTATLPLSKAMYQIATGSDKEAADQAIVHKKTTESYFNLMEGSADLILAYAPPEELMDVIEESGRTGESFFYDYEGGWEREVVPLEMKAIGRDALVFLANGDNPVESLTGEELVDIYTGEIDRWSRVGGADEEIKAFQRPAKSGSQNLMEKLVMKGEPMMEPIPEMVAGGMGELIEYVAAYDNSSNALGYSVYYYVVNMKEDSSLKLLAVDGTAPTPETIREGVYPYVNEFYVAIRRDTPEDAPARRLYDWLGEESGQMLVNSLGYVGMKKTGPATDKGLMSVIAQAREEAGADAGGTTLSFPEGALLAVPGNMYEGRGGVVVLNEHLEEVDFLEGVYADGIRFIRPEEPMVAADTRTGMKGLYMPSAGEWLFQGAEGEDGYIQEGPGAFYYMEYTGEGIRNIVFDRKGKSVLETKDAELHEGERFFWVQEGMYEGAAGQAHIYTVDGNFCRTIDLGEYGRECVWKGGWLVEEYVFLSLRDERGRRDLIFSEKGDLLYDSRNIPESVIDQMEALGMAAEGKTPYFRDNIGDVGGVIIGTGEGFLGTGGEAALLDLRSGRVVEALDAGRPMQISSDYERNTPDYYLLPAKDGSWHVYSAGCQEYITLEWDESEPHRLVYHGLLRQMGGVLQLVELDSGKSMELSGEMLGEALTPDQIHGLDWIDRDDFVLRYAVGESTHAVLIRGGKAVSGEEDMYVYKDPARGIRPGEESGVYAISAYQYDYNEEGSRWKGRITFYDAEHRELGSIERENEYGIFLSLMYKDFYVTETENYLEFRDFAGHLLKRVLNGSSSTD